MRSPDPCAEANTPAATCAASLRRSAGELDASGSVGSGRIDVADGDRRAGLLQRDDSADGGVRGDPCTVDSHDQLARRQPRRVCWASRHDRCHDHAPLRVVELRSVSRGDRRDAEEAGSADVDGRGGLARGDLLGDRESAGDRDRVAVGGRVSRYGAEPKRPCPCRSPCRRSAAGRRSRRARARASVSISPVSRSLPPWSSPTVIDLLRPVM